jgi:hypothetical protein
MIWEDPIVKETRERRREYAAPFQHDVDAIFEDIRSRQGREGRRVVIREPRCLESKPMCVAEEPGGRYKTKSED